MSIIFKTLTNYFGLDPIDLKVFLSDSLFIVSTHRFIFLIIDYYLHSYGLYPEYLKVIHIN